ncbi:hypothetical protein NDA13_004847 [Ustilago tritici]|nr:hypothetical protein NDA13_004847 [Ustilago tritici]
MALYEDRRDMLIGLIIRVYHPPPPLLLLSYSHSFFLYLVRGEELKVLQQRTNKTSSDVVSRPITSG